MSRRSTWPASLWAAVLTLGCLTPSCLAGYISEVFLADATRSDGMPDAVELAGLNGLSVVDLIVIDAAPGRYYGQVLQIITLPVVESVQWIGATAWPRGLWQDLEPVSSYRIELNTLGEADGFDFDQARTLLLYDRQTLVPTNRFNLFGPLSEILLDGAVLLDSLTFTLSGAAEPFAGGPVLPVEPGDVIARPTALSGWGPGDTLLVGQPDDRGRLNLTYPAYPVTPGWLNPRWQAAHQPEPATLSALLLGLGLTLTRRCRLAAHCSKASCRLS